MKKKKIDDLQKMRDALGCAGPCIPVLIEMQKDAIDYNSNNDDELFPKNLNSNNEVPNRLEIQ